MEKSNQSKEQVYFYTDGCLVKANGSNKRLMEQVAADLKKPIREVCAYASACQRENC